MEEAIDKMPSELSGGMRRRVSIARAVISEPVIMLYDSPTAGLDPVTSYTIDTHIAQLRDTQGVTSLVVTHRLQDAYFLANYVFSEGKQALVPAGSVNRRGSTHPIRFLLLRDSAIYFQGTPQELAATHDPYLLKYLA
jgi:phospholipid/cholesterol/gamma-HCH transport system ATP-binding protein